MADYMRIEDLEVYQRLCQLHLIVCEIVRGWPKEEQFELSSQVRRSSNSSPANLAEKHSDRHLRNKIEGVNRARGEALETVHHLHIAKMKGYVGVAEYDSLRQRYIECVRMLNGLERALEKHLPGESQRWPQQMASNKVTVSEHGGQPGEVSGPRAPALKPDRTTHSDPNDLNPNPRIPKPRTRILNSEP